MVLAALSVLGWPAVARAERAGAEERAGERAGREPRGDGEAEELTLEDYERIGIQRRLRQRQRRELIAPAVMLGLGLAIALVGGVIDIVAYREANPEERFDSLSAYDAWTRRTDALALAGDTLVLTGALAFVGGLVALILTRRGHRRQHRAALQSPEG